MPKPCIYIYILGFDVSLLWYQPKRKPNDEWRLQLLQALQGSGLDGVGDDGGFKSGYCIQNNC